MASLNTLWKKGSGKPLIGDLVEGGLGIDTQGGKAYTKDASGSIVELGASTSATQNEANFAQHGLIPTDGVNEIRPQDMFMEIDVADTLVDKKGYPVSFTDGIYDRLGDELITTTNISDNGNVSIISNINSIIHFSTSGDGRVYIPFNYDISKRYLIEASIIKISGDYVKIDASDSVAIGGATSNDFIRTSNSGIYTGIITPIQTVSSQIWIRTDTAGEFKVAISVKELPQFTLPKAPFATGSTDELLDDAVNGVTTQTNHSKGDLVVSGNELVINGTFDSDVSGWTAYFGGVLTLVSGRLSITGNGASTSRATTPITVVSGRTYNLTIDFINSSNIKVLCGVSVNTDGSVATFDTSFASSGTIQLEFTATTTVMYVSLSRGANDAQEILFDNISVKAKDDIHIALQDTTAGDLITDTAKFKAIPYATKQVALLVEKTSAGAILNTSKVLTTMYGEESVLTYEADIMGELGYSQAKDRVWTDGSSEFILLGLKGYLNAGAYHPFFNTFGVKNYGKTDNYISQSSWYTAGTSTVPYSNLTYNHFKSVSLGGVVSDNSTNGVIGGFSGRPDSKFYDKTYIDGQGGLACFSIPNAKTPTYKHQQEVKRNLVDGYIENGVELFEAEITSAVGYLNGITYISNGSINNEFFRPSTNNFISRMFSEGHTIYFTVGGEVYGFVEYTSTLHLGVGKLVGGVLVIGDYTAVITNGVKFIGQPSNKSIMEYIEINDYSPVCLQKSNYLATSGNQTHTDLIGDPANYPQDVKNILASGKGLGFCNALLVDDEGNSLIDVIISSAKLSKKSISGNLLGREFYDGSIWALYGNTFDSISNKPTNTLDTAGKIALASYTAQNQSAVSIDTPRAIEVVDMDMLATNSHSVYAYNGLTYTSSGKVATGAVVEAKGVDDVVLTSNDYDEVVTYIGQVINLAPNRKYLVMTDAFGEAVNGDIIEYLGTVTNADYTTASGNFDYKSSSSWWFKGIYLGTPKHSTLTLDTDSIVGSKALVTQTANATQVFTQEMLYDSVNTTWHDSDDFDQLTSGTTTNLNGDTIQTKVLYKASSINLGGN